MVSAKLGSFNAPHVCSNVLSRACKPDDFVFVCFT